MVGIEKATFAIWLVRRLLASEKRILAIASVRHLYKAGIKQAKEFVDQIEHYTTEEPKE